MNGADGLRGLGEAMHWSEMIEGMSGPEIGRAYGVHRSVGWRAARGETANPKFTKTDRFNNLKAAEAFRRWSEATIKVGKVKVNYAGDKRRHEGTRFVPAVEIEDPEEIASYIEDGDYDGAADALSAQIMAAYGAGEEDAVYLEISDWPPEMFEP